MADDGAKNTTSLESQKPSEAQLLAMLEAMAPGDAQFLLREAIRSTEAALQRNTIPVDPLDIVSEEPILLTVRKPPVRSSTSAWSSLRSRTRSDTAEGSP